MKHVAILISGYYPRIVPIGLVFEKIRSLVCEACDIEFFQIRRKHSEKQVDFHGGCRINTVSNWSNDWNIPSGRFSNVKHLLSRMVFLMLRAPRFQNREDCLTDAFCKALEKRHEENAFDVVVSFAAPVLMHAVAAKFKRNHPEVRWVTYSADTSFDNPVLPTSMPIRALRGLFVAYKNCQELHLYKSADFNLFTPEIAATLKKRGILPERSDVLEYPFFNCNVIRGGVSCLPDKSAINLVYAGGVDLRIRTPEYLISIIELLPAALNVKCHFFIINHIPECVKDAESRNPDKFIIHKPLTPDAIREVMMTADALINLGNNSEAFSPSKLYDYLSTGKPLLNFYYKGKNQSALLSRYPIAFNVENFADVNADATRLAEFLADNRGRSLTQEQVETLFPEHVASCVANKFIKSLQE